MKSALSILKKPLFWFSLFLAFVTIDNNLLDGEFKNVIRSDGRGYYAYLPAAILYNDPTFEASLEAETRNAQPNFNQYYLYQNEEGRVFNKYFPGIAVLQTPFFAAGCLAAVISGAPVDGYSEPFEFAFLLGSLFYTLLGVWLFHRCIQMRFPWLKDRSQWLVMAIFLCTTLLMYNTVTLGLSHHYSFFLFSLFTYLILKYRDGLQWRYVLMAGLTLGLIALVRPTNVLVLLAVPLLFNDWAEFRDTVSRLFENRGRFLLSAVGGFLAVFSIQFFLWKWQSGHWINWSYSGEGFNFLHPAFWENLFSFRNGLFLHTPIMLVSAIASFWLLRENKFLFFSWWIYFLVNTWVISSWWCWDYETSFGNRPFTEHTFLLLIPLLQLGQFRKRFLWYTLCFFFVIGWIRYQNYSTGAMIDQRFTRDNYLASLTFWDDDNHDRWRYGRSVEPFGNRINEAILAYDKTEKHVASQDEFIQTVEYDVPRNRTNERLYFRVWLEKKSSTPLEHVSLVVHATDNDSEFTHYHAIPLYNDRLAGINEWTTVSLSGQIPDHFNDFEKVKIYIWNQGKESFDLRNIRIFIDTYKS
ncbi:MAG: hypothetical protein ACFHU9_09575 [Fluviicola sp.]